MRSHIARLLGAGLCVGLLAGSATPGSADENAQTATPAASAPSVAEVPPLPEAKPRCAVVSVFDPSVGLGNNWIARTSKAGTEFAVVQSPGGDILKAESADRKASSLIRKVRVPLSEMPFLQFAWKVDKVQTGADIRVREKQDFAGAVIVMFGASGRVGKYVPSIGYVWTGTDVPSGTVVRSVLHPETRAFIQLEGKPEVGTWRSESRNVQADYKAVFGTEPPGPVRSIVIFIDSDNTGEQALAFYGPINFTSCASNEGVSVGVPGVSKPETKPATGSGTQKKSEKDASKTPEKK